MKFKLIPLLFACLVPTANAVDLGVQANIWQITEVDIRQKMMESASRLDLKKIDQQRKDSAKNFLENLPKRRMPVAETTEITWTDPSVVVQEDIQVPVKQQDGTWKWGILYPKGFRSNPLDGNVPVTAMLFIDGNDPEQIELAVRLTKLDSRKFMLVEAGQGNVDRMSKQFVRPVFYANDQMLGRFNVTRLPSLLFANRTIRKGYMGVLTFARPFDFKAARAWDGVSAAFQQLEKTNAQAAK